MSRDGVQITIYIDDPDRLPQWLGYFQEMGFVDWDWCEMHNPDDKGVCLTYAPCEKLTYPEAHFEQR